jgi:hypothetical protein
MADDYDLEETDDSGSALSGITNSLIDLGTQAASGYLQNSSIAAQPYSFETIPTSPIPQSNSNLFLLVFVVLIAFVLYKVL